MKKRLVLVCLLFIILFIMGCSQIQNEIDDVKKKKEITNRILGENSEYLYSNEKIDCNLPVTQREFTSEPYYTGPLIDSHVHMPLSSEIVSTVAAQFGLEDMPSYDDELSIDNIACAFESEGIIKAFGFNVIPKYAISKSINKVKSNEKRHPGKFVHFYQPTPISALNPDPKKVDQILTDNSEFFKGYGEVKYNVYEDDEFGLFDEEYLEVYDIVDKHNIMVMMHPGPEHKEEVMEILEKHPDVNFLFHGGESSDWIVEVLENNDNAYKTIQPNDELFGWSDLNDPNQVIRPTKEEYLGYMRKNFDSALESELNFKKTLIEQHPGKYMWGTDRANKWEFDPEVGAMIEEFGRAFIAQLDPEVQEYFAYKNAERILGERSEEINITIKLVEDDSEKKSNFSKTKLGCCFTCSEFALEIGLYTEKSCLSNPAEWQPLWKNDPKHCLTTFKDGEHHPDLRFIDTIKTCKEFLG